jgi:hypothetical protein
MVFFSFGEGAVPGELENRDHRKFGMGLPKGQPEP